MKPVNQPVTSNPRRVLGAVISIGVAIGVLFALPASAFQGQTGGPGPTSSTSTSSSSTTTAPGGSSTSTTVPGSTIPGETTVPESTTTTIPFVPSIPPELADDPRLPYLVDPGESDAGEVPIAQRSFDPRSVEVLPERVAESKLVLAQAVQAMAAAGEVINQRRATLALLEQRVATLSAETKKAVRRAADARQRLRDHAVIAYTTGRSDPKLSIIEMTSSTDVGIARQYMSVVLDRGQRLAKEYEKARKKLDSENADLADQLGVERSKLGEDQVMVDATIEAVRKAIEQLAAYEAGAQAYIDGFVFPVAADTEFIDSWGYPRMTGTASAHWHEGTDIFADYASPVIAAENGVIDRLGQASLGGNKFWVKADSGVSYYYAHLSAFADGMVDGRRVKAGEVLGYVGDTGNAKGTSPHLHFEVHPDGGDAVNPYPLLKAAYGNRPVFKAVVATTVPTTTVPSDTGAHASSGG